MDETGKSEDSGARIFHGCTGVKMNNRVSENHIEVPAGAYIDLAREIIWEI